MIKQVRLNVHFSGYMGIHFYNFPVCLKFFITERCVGGINGENSIA